MREAVRLSYEVCVKLVERADHDRIHFFVDREAPALAAAGERTFDDDLITVLYFSVADYFYGANVIF
jgi:hypothetical protein